MTTVPIRCQHVDCLGIVRIDKSRYDDSHHTELVNVQCPEGHRFDFQKNVCPRCGSQMDEPRWAMAVLL